MKISSLDHFHKGNGAVFVEREGWSLPSRFGGPAAEYDAVRSAAGWLDLADRTLLSVTGPDSVEWLQGMLSNDVAALGPGDGTPAAVLNIQGKILADVRVFRDADGFLLDLNEPLAAGIVEHLNHYLIADEVEISDRSGDLAMLSIQGAGAETALTGLLNAVALPAADLAHAELECPVGRLRVIRASHTGEPGFDIVATTRDILATVSLPAASDIAWIGHEARQTLRIEAGIPLYGVDMDADTLLLETSLDNAISFTKGCYLGQETVERIHSRGHVNRRLTGLKIEGDVVPDPGDPLLDGDRGIGRVTSATASPRTACPIALGYVHRDHLAPGSPVTIAHGDATMAAAVHTLPF